MASKLVDFQNFLNNKDVTANSRCPGKSTFNTKEEKYGQEND